MTSLVDYCSGHAAQWGCGVMQKGVKEVRIPAVPRHCSLCRRGERKSVIPQPVSTLLSSCMDLARAHLLGRTPALRRSRGGSIRIEIGFQRRRSTVRLGLRVCLPRALGRGRGRSAPRIFVGPRSRLPVKRSLAVPVPTVFEGVSDHVGVNIVLHSSRCCRRNCRISKPLFLQKGTGHGRFACWRGAGMTKTEPLTRIAGYAHISATAVRPW